MSEALARNWPEDYALENGNYTNVCSNCEKPFRGHKRRPMCKECSERRLAQLKAVAESNEEYIAAMRHLVAIILAETRQSFKFIERLESRHDYSPAVAEENRLRAEITKLCEEFYAKY